MDDFVRSSRLLASPATDPALRAQADAWLAAFRRDPAAWGVAVSVLRAGQAAVAPEVRLQAAALLAWKCKQQLAQLQPVERQLELAEALTALVAEGQLHQQPDVAQRAMCTALANLTIHCSAWERPLDTLGQHLGAACMLEFLTLLPQECEDAVAAAQSASAEVAWALKARAQDWSSEVAAFLGSVLAEACGNAAGTPQAVVAAALARPGVLQLMLAVLRCFTAWSKLGCLLDGEQAAYFASLAGELLFVADPQRGLPYHPLCLPAAVDAASEVIEHATEALQPLLAQLAAALPRRAAALNNNGAEDEAAELAHVFALFCSTHCALCGAEGPEGEALRQGLLQLLALPPRAGADGGGAALPAMAALGDLLEHLLLHHRALGDANGSGQATRVVGQPGRRAFAASALEVLLLQLQPFPAAFDARFAAPPGSEPVQHGLRSPEGVLDGLRREAASVIEGAAELLGADEAVQQLVTHVQAAAARHGLQSPAAQAALDASLHLLSSTSGLLESCSTDWAAGEQPPAWLEGLLRLFGMVPQVSAASGAGPLLTILHADLLNCWCQLGPIIMPLLRALPPQHQQEMQQLVLGQALYALSDCPRTPDVATGSTDDAIEHAASALRVLCSAAAATSLPTSVELLGGLQSAMALLQQPVRYQLYQEAHGQVVGGLVHALHGVPPGDLQLRTQAEAVVQAAVLQPLGAALQEVGGLIAAQAAVQPAAVRAATWRLHAALRQLQALLNGLESYAWYAGTSSCSNSSGSPAKSGAWAANEVVARGVAAAAVAALLSYWPQLAEVCGWVGRLPAGAVAARQELYQELAQCVCSAMVLAPEAAQRVLPSFADTVATAFFLPGASALSRPLIQALESYSASDSFQQLLLGTVATILAQPPARQLAAIRGGDADPEAAQALLSLLSCCLRQARQWRSVSAPTAVEAVLSVGLPLAAANAACNHRDTALQAVGTLSAVLALMLATDSPLHGALLRFAAQHGSAILQGLLSALLSLSSASSSLPKVVSLMSDTALLAVSLAIADQQQQSQPGSPASLSPDATSAAAARLLESWLPTAQAVVLGSGLLCAEALAALLSQWDWRPVLQQAAAQLLQSNVALDGNGSSVVDPRRAMQRSVRMLADVIRRQPRHV